MNKSVLVYDDGRDTEVNFVDNDKSSTRFGLRGSQALSNGLTASVLLEAEVQSNQGASNDIAQRVAPNQASTPAAIAAAGITERHTRVGLAGNWGAVFVGRTGTATDGITEIDIAGADDVLGSGVDRFGGGLSFRQNNIAGTPVRTVGEVFDNLDGIGSRSHAGDRVQSIRYDSPIFNGFQARIATAQGGDIDAAVLYSGKIDAFEVRGGVGYVAFNNGNASTGGGAVTNVTNDILDHQWAGSVSVKHDSGIGGTFAYGQQSLDRKSAGNDDPSFYYVKLGYTWDAFEVAADYSHHSDMFIATTVDHDATAWGLAGQYNMGNGVSLAALYRHLDLDLTGTSTDAIHLYALNLRVKF
ncbi:hypothetical protein SL003B_0603 [Polymorphum gilvum SL003B-26A1]|uniref:Porin domain-containing protein n=1 Tax=Polymorphum gilvum (strain LMG 25793 / CGMCC 1.9160 / SL003B-26A1) TaxID=991905 RepID=F2J4U4_POLGS|nr:hypothetical protein SL003B_0603 [Polymorphum gilvum SL003B-26A1]